MSSAAPPLLKPLSRAHCCLTSVPTLFTTKASHPFLSIHPKPTNLTHLSCFSSSTPLPSRLSLKPKVPSSSFTTLVAQTSDWAQQEEAQEDTIGDTQAPVSEWNPEGEESSEGDEEGSYQEPPEEAKLFVGNLHFEIDSEKLAQLFDQAGVVEVAEVIYNRETDRSRGFGFVTMSTVEEAEKAVEMFHRYDVNGRLLTVNKAAPKGTQAERPPRVFEASFRIYVGNLPWEVDNASLEQVFSEHGKVVDARVVFDRETGRSRGFGFVTMSSQTEVDDAVAALDGQSLGGRPIRVNIAEERPRRSFF